MKQGEIWLADLNPVKGSEQQGFRPVVIISGNAMNDHLGISIICPLTSKIKNYAGCLIVEANEVNGLPQKSEVITFQIRTLAHERLSRKIGVLTKEQVGWIRRGLTEVLTY